MSVEFFGRPIFLVFEVQSFAKLLYIIFDPIFCLFFEIFGQKFHAHCFVGNPRTRTENIGYCFVLLSVTYGERFFVSQKKAFVEPSPSFFPENLCFLDFQSTFTSKIRAASLGDPYRCFL